jgi:mRNA-degrading endonuclease RelE of RelBE toxin-antitoxin system
VRHRLFIESRIFTKLIGNYLDDDEYSALQRHLLARPAAGPIIRGSGGVRKLRWSVPGKGKSGGVRVIYYIPDGSSFWMLTIYSKGEVETIPGPLLKKIKEAMEDGKA